MATDRLEVYWEGGTFDWAHILESADAGQRRGYLTTDHPRSAGGLPVLVDEATGGAVGPADLPAGAALCSTRGQFHQGAVSDDVLADIDPARAGQVRAARALVRGAVDAGYRLAGVNA